MTPELPTRIARTHLLAPGVGLALVVSAASLATSRLVATTSGVVVSPLVLAMLLGAVLGSLGGGPDGPERRLRAGLDLTARTILRTGVVLLGLELSLGHLLALGWRGLAVIAITVVSTFAGTLALGRALHVPALTRLYVATGFAICGAVAIAAMRGVVAGPPADAPAPPDAVDSPADGPHDALGTALALVTVYGSIAIAVLPLVAASVGLTDTQAGLWIGASVQEVAQVVAAAGLVSGTALAAATVAKLARVVLLAPLLATVSVARTGGAGSGRTRLVPGFVLGFLAAVLLRSTGVLPGELLDVAGAVRDVLLAAAMFALGTSVDVVRLVRTGRRSLALGAAAASLCAGVGLVATVVLT